MFRKMLHWQEKSKSRALVLPIAVLAISLYGIFTFFQRQMPDYLLLKAHFVFFDEQKSAALHFSGDSKMADKQRNCGQIT